MQTIDHPNIVKYLEAYEDSTNIYVVMEMCQGGNLFDSRQDIVKNGSQFTEQEAAAIIKKLLSALNHCHSLDIVH